MSSTALNSIAQAMVAPNKGILAADESNPTIAKRFKDIDTESTEANRQTYRNMLFTSPGISDYISGVILFDETIRQTNSEGIPFPEYLTSLGIVPGIKVDKGAKELAACPGEVNSIFRYVCRFASVDSVSISLNLLAIVGLLSSAANIPLLGATIACAIEFNAVELISFSPNFRY
jgi:hypothetical protein